MPVIHLLKFFGEFLLPDQFQGSMNFLINLIWVWVHRYRRDETQHGPPFLFLELEPKARCQSGANSRFVAGETP
jgi:hypothetical protein